jgi:hypothetical protein
MSVAFFFNSEQPRLSPALAGGAWECRLHFPCKDVCLFNNLQPATEYFRGWFFL